MHRRDILKQLAALPLATLSGRLYAAPASSAKMLVVFMRGAYDAANLLVPVNSSFYYESRPNISIPRPGDAPGAALALDSDWGLHPAFRDTLYPLFKQGQVAYIPFAGTDDLTRSHFETQDTIEMGQAIDTSRNYQSGFLNRLVATLASDSRSLAPVAFTEQPPIVFRGASQIPNIALKSMGKPGIDARQGDVIAAMYKQTALQAQVSEGFAVRDAVLQSAAREMDAASRNAVSAKGLELEARRIARLIKDRFNVGFVDVGGWDTHVGQGGSTGYLSNRFEELGRAMAGFADEMGEQWRDTVVVVISEFGRTFRENGNRGTDHGHGTVYWVMGGNVRGGRVAGEQVKVERRTLFQDRDYPVLNEYRSVFGGIFQKMYGLNASQLDKIFAGVQPRQIGLI